MCQPRKTNTQPSLLNTEAEAKALSEGESYEWAGERASGRDRERAGTATVGGDSDSGREQQGWALAVLRMLSQTQGFREKFCTARWFQSKKKHLVFLYILQLFCWGWVGALNHMRRTSEDNL